VLTRNDCSELQALVADGNTAQKIVRQELIVLLTAEGSDVTVIMRAVDVSKTIVWRWLKRFVEAGVADLIKGRTGQGADRRRDQASATEDRREGAAGACDAMEHAHARRGDRHQPFERPAHASRARSEAASDAHRRV
jgi:DNA-binding MarR family transcriptional regulator